MILSPLWAVIVFGSMLDSRPVDDKWLHKWEAPIVTRWILVGDVVDDLVRRSQLTVGFYWTKLRSTTCSHARWSDLCMTIWLPWGKSFHYLQHLRFCLWCFWMVMVKIMRVCLTAFQHRPRLRSRGDKNVLPSRQDWEGSKFLQT